MAIAKITKAGLSSIAVLVVLLWSCIIGEHMMVRRANREFSSALNEIRALRMKKSAEPAAAPAPRWKSRRVNPTVG